MTFLHETPHYTELSDSSRAGEFKNSTVIRPVVLNNLFAFEVERYTDGNRETIGWLFDCTYWTAKVLLENNSFWDHDKFEGA